MKNLFASFSLVLVSALSVPAFAADPAPAAAKAEEKGPKFTGEALVLKKSLEELFEQSKGVNAKGAKQTQARAAIEKGMDWDQIAKDCLPADAWAKAGSKGTTEFRGLLKDVIVKTAYTRLDTFWNNAEYHFSKIDVTGSKAHAQSIFDVKGSDGTDQFILDYYAQKKGGAWVIYDVAFDEVRYSENIREQIKTYLAEKGFPSLLGKLRERRAELNEGKKG